MGDIVERLVEHADQAHESGSLGWRDTMNEAADTVTALRAEVERLRAENFRLRSSWATLANNINIQGSAYEKALQALEDLMHTIKAETRAALTQETPDGK
jgi:archaellum component FlaC